MKRLPIGIQTFSKIRTEDYYYIDKTEIFYRLLQVGTYYFLSRPRRFGKSLFLDTIQEAFSGNRELFRGLFLEKNWDWSVRHPVIKIDLGCGVHKDPVQLEQYIREILMRDILRTLYSVIKTSDAHIQFVFITGVSKFSKVNLFSGLNNIMDITLKDTKTSDKEFELLNILSKGDLSGGSGIL